MKFFYSSLCGMTVYRIISLSISLVLMSFAAEARTYYVNNSFATSGSGLTPATAFITIQEGVNAAMADGDRVIIAPGIYVEAVTLGSVNITLTGAGAKGNTIISGTGLPSGDGILINQGQSRSTVIQDIRIQNFSANDGIEVSDSSPTLRRLVVSNNEYGLRVACTVAPADCSPLLMNSTIEDNSEHGVDLSGSASMISQNIITTNRSECGVCIDRDDESTINANSIYANAYAGIYSVSDHSAVIINNLIYGNVFYGIFMDTAGSVNAVVAYNTIAANGDDGMEIIGDGGGVTSIYNNIFYGNTGYGLDESTRTEVTFGNNIFYSNTSGDYRPYSDAINLGTNISEDPLFFRPALNNYRPRDSSPAIGAADSSLYSTPRDFYGTSRGDHGCSNDGIDIGAIECDR